jgi:choline monooxygenase
VDNQYVQRYFFAMHLNEKLSAFDSERPLETAATIPSLWYFDPEIAALEAKTIFHNGWQAIGSSAHVSEPGQYVTTDLAGEPLAIVRDKEGTLQCLSNVCRHRGTVILTAEKGKVPALSCRYHGWTYDLKGALKAAPEFEGVQDFCREKIHLPRFRAETWGPFLFAHLGEPKESLQQYLAPFLQEMSSTDFSKLKFTERRTYDIQCNWKVFVDNYLDGGYHVNTLHKALAGVIDYAEYRTRLFEKMSVQESPLRPSENAAVNSVRRGKAYYWWMFPNLMINVYEGLMDVNIVVPLGPDRCRVWFDFFFEETEGSEARAFIEGSMKVAHQVQLEDQEICESVQRGLKSQSYDTGRFSVKREAGGYHFHRLLAGTLKKWPAE